jgi:fused signal recognition particle receptor
MEQIEKITKVVKPDLKIFVGDSLAGNDTVNQAREFYQHVEFDGAILTKSDADARGGAALSVVKITSKPVLYVGVGQEYQDLKPFDKKLFLQTVFGESTLPKPELKPEPKPELKPEPKPELKPEPKPELKPEPKKNKDPFEGINDKDISRYADLYDVPPPESDDEAFVLAQKIKKWIESGRPKPGEQAKEEKKKPEPSEDEEEKKVKEEKEAKPKKGLFGWRKK